MHKSTKKNLIAFFLAISLFINFYIINLDFSQIKASVSSLSATSGKEIFKKAKIVAPKRISFHKAFVVQEKQVRVKNLNFCNIDETSKDNNLYQAEYLKTTIPQNIQSGDYFKAEIYLKNTGNVRWISDNSGCQNFLPVRLGTKRNQDRQSIFWISQYLENVGWVSGDQKNRIELKQDYIDPGETGIFMFYSKAPEQIGIYREYFAPLVEGLKWFDNTEDFYLDIVIGDIAQEDFTKMKFVERSLSSVEMQGIKNVEVDLSEQKMYVKHGETVIWEMRISSGARKTPTPYGEFEIKFKQEVRIASGWPRYIMPKFQGFDRPKNGFRGYGFHALPSLSTDGGVFWTEALSHIGIPVSHGCIRMLPWDAEKYFEWTEVGTRIY